MACCILGSKEIIQYDDQLSRPYDLTYVDLTSNSVKLLFFFNETNPDPRRRIQKLEVRFLSYTGKEYLLSNFYLQIHYDGIQNYIDGLGTARTTSHHNLAAQITIPATQGAREWLVTGLTANTQYTFNLSGTISSSEQSPVKVYSRPATLHFSTDFDAPPFVERPEQDRRNLVKTNALSTSPHLVYLRLHHATTRNGPIDRYYIVVHLIEHVSYQAYVPQEV